MENGIQKTEIKTIQSGVLISVNVFRKWNSLISKQYASHAHLADVA